MAPTVATRFPLVVTLLEKSSALSTRVPVEAPSAIITACDRSESQFSSCVSVTVASNSSVVAPSRASVKVRLSTPAQAVLVNTDGHSAARRPWGCTKLHSCGVQGLF